ncbi:type I methionyl aminopeptidase [Pontiella sulfatireligans]|uniref:Methionine aminopeptidase n=1 Tax=Pontiella sulfatireligans TaxID=2750658 RepID=A0A6C2UMN5_9BACT|nr:type I methionyl aminopeptidase [Pontiella sulfatireligans]VGO20531.1 Methionine aminopeptidase 1 [Pontiella sulfatireligans]
MIIVKNQAELNAMRIATKKTATILHKVAAKVAPGVTTQELDDYAAELARKAEGRCAFYGYHGFSGHICSSVNEEVVHGIPGRRVIKDGDVVGIDFGLVYGGFVGDTAITVAAGEIDPEWQRLLDKTQECLTAAIGQAVEGNRLSDISNAVQVVAEEAGFSVVRDFVGHGIGREMHEDPQIPNYGPPGRGPVLKAGMTFAIEPMINLGIHKTETLKDGWTVVTKDRLPSAHFEHTVAVGKEVAEILTIPDLES